MQNKIIILRDFEERDIDFMYKAKNDPSINKNTVDDFKPYTYEETKEWVRKCIDHDETYKFFAIATNDDSKTIVGWCGFSNIDLINKTATFHGITIADKRFRHWGIACYQSAMLFLDYAFNILMLNALYAYCLDSSIVINIFFKTTFPNHTKLVKNGALRNGVLCDLFQYEITKEEYRDVIANGNLEYETLYNKYKNYLNG